MLASDVWDESVVHLVVVDTGIIPIVIIFESFFFSPDCKTAVVAIPPMEKIKSFGSGAEVSAAEAIPESGVFGAKNIIGWIDGRV